MIPEKTFEAKRQSPASHQYKESSNAASEYCARRISLIELWGFKSVEVLNEVRFRHKQLFMR